MKFALKKPISEAEHPHDSAHTVTDAESDFDKRWIERFGEPRTRVLTVAEFDELWQEMMTFE